MSRQHRKVQEGRNRRGEARQRKGLRQRPQDQDAAASGGEARGGRGRAGSLRGPRGPASIRGQNGREGGLDSTSPQLRCRIGLRVTSIGVDAVRLEGTPKGQAVWNPVSQTAEASRGDPRRPDPWPPAAQRCRLPP